MSSNVRPWKAVLKDTSHAFFVAARATFTAFSMASEPEFRKIDFVMNFSLRLSAAFDLGPGGIATIFGPRGPFELRFVIGSYTLENLSGSVPGRKGEKGI